MPEKSAPTKASPKLAFDEYDSFRLVELVGDNADAVMDFRVFPESKAAKARLSAIFRAGGQLPRLKYRGKLTDLLPKLRALNSKGFGVYYSLNKSDGRGVKSANIRAVRVIPVDLDTTEPPDIWDIEPHMVMRSSPGRHQALFMIEATTNFELAADVAKRMAIKFGGDPNVHDRARVFRLPGSYHLKAVPYRSRIISIDHFARRYTLEELDALLPPLPRRVVGGNDKGVGSIGINEARLLFENLGVECLSGNEKWQRFAMALHSACNGDEEVAELFFEYCSSDANYDDDDTDARNRLRWDSFDASKDGGVGVGTLRRMCLEFRVPGLVAFQLFNTASRDFEDE